MFQMSTGQKYRRTEFQEDDDNGSAGEMASPGVVYNPVIAFRAASMAGGGPSGGRCCPRRTALEKMLFTLVAGLLLVVFVLMVLLSSHSHVPVAVTSPKVTSSPSSQMPPSPRPSAGGIKPTADRSSLCTTKMCITAASSVLNSLDESVDPCEDFYQFACGGWIKSHPIPPGESRWDTFGVLRRKNQIVLKNLLELPSLAVGVSTAERKAAVYYSSCLDVNKTIDDAGSRPLVDLLWDTFGGWTIGGRSTGTSSSFNVTAWDFQRTLERTHTLGLATFFSVWVSEDDKNPTQNILHVDQSGIGLEPEQYINKSIKEDKILSAYLNFITELGVLLGGDRNTTEQAMLKVIELEQRIAVATVPYEDRRDVERMYNKLTVSDLQRLAPFVNWKNYLNSLLSVTSYSVNDSEPIIVKEPRFLEQISGVVSSLMTSAEGRITLHNYMMTRLIKTFSSYLSKPFQDAKNEFISILFGSAGDKEQWSYCVADTENVLPFAVGALFVRDAFDGNSKHTAEEMISYIKDAFKQNIHKVDWMNEDTRKAAIDKADAMKNLIGFPEYILNMTSLDERYKELTIEEKDYFGNNLRAVQYLRKRNLDKLRKIPDKNSWTMAPSTINAYYTPTRNEIIFLAGILQAPFFDKAYPKSLNYGGVGVVMGHELTHGFDDQGREYDKSGVLRPWWNDQSIHQFKQHAQCFDDQYSAYEAFGEHLRGRQTLGENIADSGGLKSAFYAYKDWTSKHGVELALPGVNFTNEQLFFVAFAQVWCTNSRHEDYHMSILSDSHSLPMFRVRGPLSNSREFAEQFQCAAGSSMNPKKKCEVW